MVSRILAPISAHDWILRSCECYLRCKKGLCRCDENRTSRGEDPGLSRRAQSRPKSLKAETFPAAENQTEGTRRRTSWLCKWGWVTLSHRMRANSRSWKKQRNGFCCKVSIQSGRQSYYTLIFAQ